jgi:hypothetical protein
LKAGTLNGAVHTIHRTNQWKLQILPAHRFAKLSKAAAWRTTRNAKTKFDVAMSTVAADEI